MPVARGVRARRLARAESRPTGQAGGKEQRGLSPAHVREATGRHESTQPPPSALLGEWSATARRRIYIQPPPPPQPPPQPPPRAGGEWPASGAGRAERDDRGQGGRRATRTTSARRHLAYRTHALPQRAGTRTAAVTATINRR